MNDDHVSLGQGKPASFMRNNVFMSLNRTLMDLNCFNMCVIFCPSNKTRMLTNDIYFRPEESLFKKKKKKLNSLVDPE